MVSIIVAFPKNEDAKGIRSLLVRNGFNVQGAANNGASVVNIANSLDSGIVVCGYKFADMVYHEVAHYLPQEFKMLLVASKQVLDQCQGEDIMGLSMPLKAYELLQTLAMMVDNMEAARRRKKRRPPHRSEEEIEILEQAKRVLTERNNLTEEEAHRYIQKNSMDTGRTMVETAQMLLSLML